MFSLPCEKGASAKWRVACSQPWRGPILKSAKLLDWWWRSKFAATSNCAARTRRTKYAFGPRVCFASRSCWKLTAGILALFYREGPTVRTGRPLRWCLVRCATLHRGRYIEPRSTPVTRSMRLLSLFPRIGSALHHWSDRHQCLRRANFDSTPISET